MSETYTLRIGLLGIGLQAYWAQFAGLEERLKGYVAAVEDRIAGNRRTVVNFGLVDTPQKAIATAHACRREDVDVLLVYCTTYALSAIVLPVIQRAKVPVFILNIQPQASIDYARIDAMPDAADKTGEWLAYCGACPVPEIANVLRRLQIPFQQLTGVLDSNDPCWQQMESWLRAAEVVHALQHGRLGLMGHYYSGMLDIATDLAQVSGRFGLHIEMLEVDELSALRTNISHADLEKKLKAFDSFFQIGEDCSASELQRAARTSIALDTLVTQKQLDLLAYYYKGTGIAENEDTLSSIILAASMLTGNHVPVAGEYEVKNVIAMKVMDLLGAGGSFTEYYANDFKDDLVLMGHDGPGHIGIAQGKIRIRPLRVYHGKVGNGLSVEMQVKNGPVTLLSIVEDKDHGFRFLVAEGESVPGPVLEIGNTNSRYKFSIGARAFNEQWNAEGPAHHCAIGIGHIADQLKKVATLLNMNFTQIC